MSEERALFKPQIIFDELDYYIDKFNEKQIENTGIYELVKKLTCEVLPCYQDEFDKRWENFCLPVKRRAKVITLLFDILEYKKEFFVHFRLLGSMHIKKGSRKEEEFYERIFSEALRFIPVIKADRNVLEKSVPYDLRTGKIKGSYLMEKVLSKNSKEKMLKDYAGHVEKIQEVREISLNEYLRVAGICYSTAFKKEAKSLSPPEMYKKWADGRDGGMLSIRDRDDKKKFMDWLQSGVHAGSHPFEIVFSWHRHGIHLYPPSFQQPYFSLRVTNYAYAPNFVKMVKALIKEKISFRSDELKNVLDYLAGETYFMVNDYGEHNFWYIPSREYKKKFFRHIEWDKIKIPEWKKV